MSTRIALVLTILVLPLAAVAGWDLHVSPYFSPVNGFQRLSSGPILAGTQGGLFVSFDEGSTWSFSGLGSLDEPNAGNDVPFDALELDDGTVYVAVDGVFRADPGLGGFTRVPWPANVEHMEAAGDTVWATNGTEIHRSLDRGATWDEVWAIESSGDYVTEMRRNPATGALVLEFLRPGGLKLLVSADGGVTWELRPLGGVFGESCGMAFTDDGTLWIGHNYQNRGYLRTSTDNGLSTAVVYTAPNNRELGDLTHGPGNRIAMTEGYYLVVSEDGGASFQQRVPPRNHPEPLFFTGGERLLAGTSDGVAISEDEGDTWTFTTAGLWANDMIDADVVPGGTAWIASSGRLWHDAAGGWPPVPLPGGDGQQVHVLRATSSGRVLLLGTDSGTPEGWYTDDAGASWTPMTGLDALSSWSRWADVTEHAGTLYAGHEGLGLLVSTDDGASWTQRSATPRGRIDRAGDGRLWSSGALGLHVSDDDGVTWSPVGAVGPTAPGAASPTTAAVVVPEWSAVKRSLDGGATWTNVVDAAWLMLLNDGLTLSDVQAVGYAADGALLMAVTCQRNAAGRKETRLLSSPDDGDTWTDVTGDGVLNRAVVERLRRSAHGMNLALANMGLFGDEFTPDVAVEDPGAAAAPPTVMALGRNRPHPFNPRTEIPFSLAEPGRARLTVTDLRGRTVAVLVDGPLASGRHVATFDGARLESGLYLYRLETAAGVASGKMSLVK